MSESIQKEFHIPNYTEVATKHLNLDIQQFGRGIGAGSIKIVQNRLAVILNGTGHCIKGFTPFSSHCFDL